MTEPGEWARDHQDIVDAIRGLRPGHVVEVETETKSHPTVTLQIVDGSERPGPTGECAPAVRIDSRASAGAEYELDPLYSQGLETLPWVRKNGKSAGAVDAIRIVGYIR